VKTRYSRRAWAGFELVFRPWMRRRLDGIRIRGIDHLTELPPDMAVLLLANHVSWWDGFLLREIHRAVRPDAPLHVVMTERELRRVSIFRWMGAVPLSPGAMAARALLRDLRDRIAAHPGAVIGFFPQGRIAASHGPITFQDGAGWLAERLAPVAVVPVGLHLEPLTQPGPAAFVSVGPPRVVGMPPDTHELEAMVATELDAVLALVRHHGEDVGTAWDGPNTLAPAPGAPELETVAA
jgi:1-acyl-sn-glycerol-3-phosphate acyltransferase